MYRHATNHWWNLSSGSFHGPERPIQRFQSTPTIHQVDKMLAPNEWQWEDETYNNGEEEVTGFFVKAGNILDDVWRAALGPPSRAFEAHVEFPEY